MIDYRYNPLYSPEDDIETRRLVLYQWKIKDFYGWFGKHPYEMSSSDLLDFYTYATLRCHGDVDSFGCSIIKHELLNRMR